MNTIPDPENLLDFVTIIAVALIAAVPTIYSARNHKTLQAVRDQVVNSHPESNLRDDLDKALAALNDLAHEVRGLRSDLLAEGQHRRAQISDIQDELDHIGKHRRL